MHEAGDSRIGLGVVASEFPDDFKPGTIYMAVGRDGYVGLTRVGGQQLNISAALDRAAVKESSPAEVCRRIITGADFPVCHEMLAADWRGTVGLTRRRKKLAATRLFAVGDAAGYVEPFTGEGMSWAIRSGLAVVPFVGPMLRFLRSV